MITETERLLVGNRMLIPRVHRLKTDRRRRGPYEVVHMRDGRVHRLKDLTNRQLTKYSRTPERHYRQSLGAGHPNRQTLQGGGGGIKMDEIARKTQVITEASEIRKREHDLNQASDRHEESPTSNNQYYSPSG